MCARAALDTAADPARLRALLGARSASVRAEALRALAADDPAAAEAALLDRHPSVRAAAQAALRRAGADPAAHYRRLTARALPPWTTAAPAARPSTGYPDGAARPRPAAQPSTAHRSGGVVQPGQVTPPSSASVGGGSPEPGTAALHAPAPLSPAVLDGLGETGGPPDADLVMPWLAHPLPRGRVAAVRALRRLGGTRPADLLPLLRDPSGAVTHQVVRSLSGDPYAVEPAVLAGLLTVENPAHVRFAAFRLATAGDAWLRLATDLRLVDDPDGRLRAAARADLAGWLTGQATRNWRGPDPQRGAELERLIASAAPTLGAHRVRLLRFHTGRPDA